MEMSVQTCGNNSQGSMCRPCIFKCGKGDGIIKRQQNWLLPQKRFDHVRGKKTMKELRGGLPERNIQIRDFVGLLLGYL